ncbi:MAG: response regulator [Desulfobacterales bacterium]|nr:response regulator [Desulfobacterales bacterium]
MKSFILKSVSFIVIAWVPIVSAQQTHELRFSHLTTADGLSHHEVTYVFQDDQRFMWFGTRSGLNKYDGVEITTYRYDPENPDSLGNNYAWNIHNGSNDTLWIATWGGGLSHFSRRLGTFTNYQHDETNPHSIGSDLVWSVHEDRQGRVWATPDGDGLNLFDPGTKTFSRYRHDPDNPNSLSYNNATTIAEDSRGILWIGTYGGGLNKFDSETETFTRYQHDPGNPNSLSNNFMWTVYIDTRERIWLGTLGGVNRFDPESETFTRYQHDPDNPNSLSHNTVVPIYEDDSGILWIGTFGGGLNRFDPDTETFTHYRHDPNDPYSLSDDTVMFIDRDKTSTLWVATFGGVDMANPGSERFIHYQHHSNNANSLSHNHVKTFYQDKTGILWIGTQGGGLNRFDRKTGQFVHYKHNKADPTSLSSNDILAISPDSQGKLWIATRGNGLNRFDPVQKTSVHYQHEPGNPNTLMNNDLSYLAVDRIRDIVWISVYGYGLDKFDITREIFVHYPYDKNNPNSPVSEWTWVVYPDSAGLVWLGAEGGLSQFDPVTETFTNYQHQKNNPKSLSNSIIQTIYEDSQGVMWIGTTMGLNRFDRATQTFIRYYKTDGLPGNLIMGITEDEQGCLWISTDKGLSKFNQNNKTFRNYDQRDGLQGNIFLGNAVCKNRTGELLFGGTNGFNIFHPSKLKDNPHIPDIVFTEFQLFNHAVRLGKDTPLKQHINFTRDIILTHDQSVFSFKFAALSYQTPLKNQYAYMMAGFDRDWIEVDSSRRFATYTNLDPGQYTFRVKASNNDSLWNEKGTSVKIVILPSWWQNWWFRGFMSLSVFGLAFGGYRWRVRTIKARARKLETQVIQRTAELFESERAMSTLLSNLPGMAYRARNDRNWTVEFASQGCYKLTGYHPDALGKNGEITFNDLIHHKDRNPVWNAVQAALKERRPYEITYRITTKNREHKWLWEQGQGIFSENGDVLWLEGLINDITENRLAAEKLRQAKEAAEAANLAKNTFLANMSHELRTPLNAILGYTQILRRTCSLTTVQADSLNIIYKSGHHLLTLINDVLDLAKIEVGKLELYPAPVSLPDLLDSVTGIIQMTAHQKDIEFVFDAPGYLPAAVEADEKRLRQVLLNLLGNAVKFTHEGSVTLHIKIIENCQFSTVNFQFSIQDTGVGMTPEELAAIFRPFEQVGDGKKRAEGTGLGLAITRQLVSLMGGEIQAESDLGRGSAFQFEIALPVLKDAIPGQPTAEIRQVIGYHGERRKILIADDTEENRLMLSDLLEPLGFDITLAANGKESIEQAEAVQPDLILMDLMMPVMNGFEAVKTIREIPGNRDVPVIAISANVFETDREKSRTAGCQEFLPKPVEPGRLFAMMKKYTGLEWIYEDAEAIPGITQSSAIPGDGIIPPPPAELEVLYKLTMFGDLECVQEKARELEDMDAKYVPFAHKLRGYSEEFEDEPILELLEHFIKPGS